MARPSAPTPHPVDISLGKKIKACRTMRGWSQAQLGKAIGVTFQQIQKYERGTNRITVSRLVDLGRVFRIPLISFLEEFCPVARQSQTGSIKKLRGLQNGLLMDKEALKFIQLYSNIENQNLRAHLRRIAKSMAANGND